MGGEPTIHRVLIAYLLQIEGLGRQLESQKAQKEDAKKIEELKKKDLPAALMKINQMSRNEVGSRRDVAGMLLVHASLSLQLTHLPGTASAQAL